jgi:hypothetical protein
LPVFWLTASMLVRMLSLPPRRLSREDVAMRTCPPVRAIVFAGTGGRAVMRLEQRPDPVPGSEELLVATTFAGVNTADLAQRAGVSRSAGGASGRSRPRSCGGCGRAGVDRA